jgi:hypothetical protein
VNTTAFCNTRSSSGYVAPSPNGQFFTFLVFWGALTRERSLVANPEFQNFLWGCDYSAWRQQTVSFFYHAINLALVNFFPGLIKARFRKGFGGPRWFAHEPSFL